MLLPWDDAVLVAVPGELLEYHPLDHLAQGWQDGHGPVGGRQQTVLVLLQHRDDESCLEEVWYLFLPERGVDQGAHCWGKNMSGPFPEQGGDSIYANSTGAA